MTEWSTYAEQHARRTISTRHGSAKVVALPFEAAVQRERFRRTLATTVSALTAVAGVLIVAASAVMLGLS